MDRWLFCPLVGKLKFNYRGTGSEKDDFDPRAICCDAVGHILLSDFGNKCVHLIDHDGTLLTYLIRTNEETCSMSLYLNQLWIGGKNGTISVYHYQMNYFPIAVEILENGDSY